MRYDDEFRAKAVLMLEIEGYPETKGALTHVAKKLGIKAQTLHNWANRKFNPPPQRNLTLKREEITILLKDELHAILHEMLYTRGGADYKELGTVLGIIVDKLQLLENKPTERITHDVNLTDETRATRINQIIDAARARGTGQPPTAHTDD